MKKRIYLLIVALAFSFGLSASAQDFNTGSDFMNSGSNYSSSVGAVGSTGANAMYETTADYPTSSRRPGARKIGEEGSGMGEVGEGSDESPIGEPLIMLLFAAAAGAVIALRRHRAA